MIKHNQDGAVSGLAISLIVAVILLLATAVFAGWAFSSRQDYKNNVDAKIVVATGIAQKQAALVETAKLAQDEKQPFYTYQGPAQYGSISFKYPRTWSAYVNTATGGSPLLDGYFMPPILSSVNDQTANFAVRVQVLGQAYSQVTQAIQSGQNPKITSRAYALPLMPNIVGIEASGPLSVAPTSTATMIILPDRTNTIEIWTDGSAYASDFNNTILPSFTFSP
jgi:hypothetical protein